MPWGFAAGAAASLIGSSMQADAATSAANTQSDSAKYAVDKQQEMMKPWLDTGAQALNYLNSNLMQPGGKFTGGFSMQQAYNQPAMQESLRGGMDAIQNSAAAKGGLLSTNTMHDLTKFGQANAAQYENQAFNQWLQERNALLGPIQSLAGQGMSTSQNVADNIGNLSLASGAARAGGIVGSANAISGGMSNLAQQIPMMSKLFGGGSSGGGTFTGNTGMEGMSPDTLDYFYSDRRLKTDIKKVGETDDGLPVYTYRYKSGGPKHMGVMAQDVEDVDPSAVREHPATGFKMVNYSKVA